MEEKIKKIKELVEEHNALLDKVNAKWDAIYEELEDIVDTTKYNEIGSMIGNSMNIDVTELDPIEQMKIDFNTLVKEIKNV